MTYREWWWIGEQEVRRTGVDKVAGNLTADDIDRLAARLKK